MFTPATTTLGATLLLLSSSTLLHGTGQILGCSGIMSATLLPLLRHGRARADTAPILLGLLTAPLAVAQLAPAFLPHYPATGWGRHLAAGALVGFGTQWAGGCTSGHMLLGVARGSRRSMVATGVFFATAMLTVLAVGSPPARGDPPAAPAVAVLVGAGVAVAVAGAGAWVLRHPRLARSRTTAVATATATRLYAGFVFGLGLLVSGMAAPAKTLGFLSVFDGPRFDPSLLLVAVVAVGGNAVLWRRRAPQPALVVVGVAAAEGGSGGGGGGWGCVPEGGEVDWRLVAGSALFGAGWGLEGICPGSGAVAAVLNGASGLGWLVAFLAGRLAAGGL